VPEFNSQCTIETIKDSLHLTSVTSES